MQDQWNSSRRPLCISQCQNRFRNANFNFAMRKFRNAKISQCEISQCQMQFRSAKIFAIPNSQCENFAKPISQCEIQFRNAKTLFICPNLCEISHCEIHNHFAKFRKPISHCEIHPAKFSGLVILCN